MVKFPVHGWPSQPPPDLRPEPVPGRTTSAARPELAADSPWTREQCEDIRRLVALREPGIAVLDRALSAPDAQMPTAPEDAGAVDLSRLRSLLLWLTVSAHYRAATADYAGSVRDIDRALGLGGLVSRGYPVLPYLHARGCTMTAAHAAWEIVVRNAMPATELEHLQQVLLRCAEQAEPLPEILRAQAAADAAVVRNVYRYGSIEFLDGRPASFKGKLVFRLAHARGSTLRRTQRNLRSYYENLVMLTSKPYSPGVKAEHDAFAAGLARAIDDWGPLGVRDPVGLHLLDASWDVPHALLHRRTAETDAILRCLALFCAVQAYRQEQGVPPDALGQLVPGYLSSVPTDPLGGKPFHYRRSGVPGLPPQAWAVYSIGADFIDNGGEASREAAGSSRPSGGPDLVWPSCPYPSAPAPR